MKLQIDQEFQSLIPQLKTDEFEQLEKNLLDDGCRDALMVWNGVLVDGHNRYVICQKHNLSFSTKNIEFSGRREAINWIINNQLGRRNLDPAQSSYLRGKRYNVEKQEHGGTGANRYTGLQRGQNDPSVKTADRLAAEYNLSPKTIKRDGQYAEAIETVAAVAKVNPQAIIGNIDKSDVIAVAKAIQKSEREEVPISNPVIQQSIQAIKSGESIKDAVKVAAREIKSEPIIHLVAHTKKPDSFITLDSWDKLSKEERELAISVSNTNKTFNRQSNDNEDSIGNIEWAKWSWNPVSGCKHDCPYCYARDIAARFYEQGFVPTLYPDRLFMPKNTKVPSGADQDISMKNVFTCSMADLFGRWVPSEWIELVIRQIEDNPQWNFLFLTKFPQRLSEFKFPDNAWLGTTVDCQARVKSAESAFRKMREEGSGGVWWLSLEPLLEPLEFSSLDMFDWVVIGGASASSKTPEWRPPRVWVDRLEEQARSNGCRIYEKTNLLRRFRQYPGLDIEEPTECPDAFKYLGMS